MSDVCVLMSSLSSLLFQSLFLFFTSKFFSSSLSHLQQRRIKNEPRKTGDVVACARRARRSVRLFILLLLGLLRLCLLLSLSLSLLIDFWRRTTDF